ncbi:MAG: thiamine phosphate synthase [Vicinamibacterales bacterium]
MLPRLYAILDVALTHAHGLTPQNLFDIWIDAGVRLIQLRAKSMASGAMLDLADALAERARTAGVTFIVNDRADIARLSGAAGVHVGQGDLTPRDVRPLLPAPALIGLSTHTTVQVTAALTQPIDYLAIGPVFTTLSKQNPDAVVGLSGVRETAAAARERPVPVVAIGGISLETAPDVIDAGADAVAIIGDLLRGDPAQRARAFVSALGR